MTARLHITFHERALFKTEVLLITPDDLHNVYELYAEPPLPAPDGCPQIEINALRLIHSTEDSAVYRASMGDLPIAIKFAFRDGETHSIKHLKQEARHYQHELKNLCGSVIPNFYGFFEGTIPAYVSDSDDGNHGTCGPAPPDQVVSAPNTDLPAPPPPDAASNNESGGFSTGSRDEPDQYFACILLEYCGVQLGGEYWVRVASLNDRRKALELLAALHREGYDLPDILPRNVVQNPRTGDCRLIGVHELLEHQCGFSGDWKFDSSRAPKEEHFGCESLHYECWRLEFWNDKITVHVGAHVFSNISFPDQPTTDRLVEPHMLEPWNEPYLIKWLKQVKREVGMSAYQRTVTMEIAKVLRIAERLKPHFPLTLADFESLYKTGYYEKKYGPEIE